MLISVYSIFVSLIIFNIWVAALIYFERNNKLISIFGIEFLLTLSIACIFRMVFAIELPFTQVISSDVILPPIMDMLKRELFDIWGIGISPLGILTGVICATLIYGLFNFARQIYYYIRLINAYRKMCLEIPEEIAVIYDRIVMELGLKKSPELICNNMVKVPFAAGFVSPMIFIPSLMDLSDQDIENIFRHELTHIKNKDMCVKLMCGIFCSLMWWNPLVHILKQDISQILEIKCDLKVCDGLDINQRATYLRTIINFISNMSGRDRDIYYTSAMSKENERCLKQRFNLVLEGSSYKKSKKTSFISISVMLVMLILSYSFVFQPHYEPDYASDSAIYLTDKDTSIVYEDGVYKIYYEGNYMMDLDDTMIEDIEMAGIEIVDVE